MSKQVEVLVNRACGLLAGLLAGILLVACGDAGPVDATGGRALLERVQTDDYRTWQRAPGWATRAPSIAGGHGGQLDIYVNDVVASVLDRGEHVSELRAGSTIVKDVWDGMTLHAIAIMDKRQDGWYWAEFDAKSAVSASGHPQGCITCHERGDDFVRAFVLP